jgi:hypothetical protein
MVICSMIWWAADTASSHQNCSRIQRQSLVMVGTAVLRRFHVAIQRTA